MRKCFLTICIIFLGINTFACDICGCGAGSNYIGVLPDFNARIVGVRYRSNNIRTHFGPDNTTTYLTTDESYRIAELWGGWTIGNRFRVMATLPVSFISKNNQEQDLAKAGLGDANVQAHYRLLAQRSTTKSNKLLVQDLWIGGGVKLPTGKYMPQDRDALSQSANLFQLGTGSTDFLLAAMYDVRLNDLGLNVSAGYKINTENKYGYWYGNRLNAGMQAYYKFRFFGKMTVAPNLGIGYENSVRDLSDGYAVYTSGGYAWYGTAGAEVNYKRFALGGNYQPAIKQSLANGAVRAGSRMMLHFGIMF